MSSMASQSSLTPGGSKTFFLGGGGGSSGSTKGLGFRVSGFGVVSVVIFGSLRLRMVQGSGFRVQGSGFKA